MRDHDDRQAAFLVQPREEPHDLFAHCRIEIAGGFVGENERRLGHHRSSNGYTLLLPPRELARSVLLAAGEAYEREHLRRALTPLLARHATVDQRQLDVLERRRAIQ